MTLLVQAPRRENACENRRRPYDPIVAKTLESVCARRALMIVRASTCLSLEVSAHTPSLWQSCNSAEGQKWRRLHREHKMVQSKRLRAVHVDENGLRADPRRSSSATLMPLSLSIAVPPCPSPPFTQAAPRTLRKPVTHRARSACPDR
eukprot:6183969-Pleurochrysis_carterae.AAC.2